MRWPIIATAALLTACSGAFGTMDRVMRSWEGATLDQVIAQWGYPHQEQAIAGRRLYHWHTHRSASIPAHTSATVNQIGSTAYIEATTTGGGTFHGACRRTIEVDEQNIVRRWQWSGNNCPFATVAGEYANWPRR
jgi:hypothetical protein